MQGLLTKLLITPVNSDCNMACGYCYNGSNRYGCTQPQKVIDMKTIHRIFSSVSPCLKSKHLIVIWHGGEPMLAGQEFYREALKVQSQAAGDSYTVTNCIQTNGTLADENWADLFAELHIGPSVSLDGPAELHNSVRTFLDGSPTYEKAMHGYRLFQSRDMNTGLLIVISKQNVGQPMQLWQWVLEQDIKHFDYLPCIEPELWRQGKQCYGLSTEEVADFSIRFFDLWYDYGNPDIRIRTFRDAIKGQIGGKANICSWKAGCLQHISFDAEGNAFACARYHSYPETSFGNIIEQSFAGIMESSTTRRVHEGIEQGKKQCHGCRWHDICGSGCPFLKYALHGDWTGPFVHCQSRMRLFEHVKKRIFRK